MTIPGRVRGAPDRLDEPCEVPELGAAILDRPGGVASPIRRSFAANGGSQGPDLLLL